MHAILAKFFELFRPAFLVLGGQACPRVREKNVRSYHLDPPLDKYKNQRKVRAVACAFGRVSFF